MIYLMISVLIILLVLFVKPIRVNLLTKFIMRYFVKSMPSISDTEREALLSGDAWLEADIFNGQINWQSVQNLKISRLNKEEQRFLDNEVVELCKLVNDYQVVNEIRDLSSEAWQYIKSQGFCGLTLAKSYGGHGFSAMAVSAIVTKLASHSFTLGVTVMVPNSLGLGELFTHFGTKEQQSEFLPKFATGEHIACFALTSPDAGSDAASLTDMGIVCYEYLNEKKTLGIKVTFNKRYITLAPIATLIGLAFRLSDPDNLLAGVGGEGITCCYIKRDHPGLIIGQRHYPCSMPIQNGPILGHDIFIPIDQIIGGQQMAGRGWSILMSALSTGRAISLPAISQGIINKQYIGSSAYASIRKQFGQPIGKFEGVQEVLSRIAGLTYIAESLRQFTASALDNGVKPAVASAITKYQNTEIGRKVINDALDIHGGRGVMDGPKNYLTSHYRGLLISITGEGANIMTRNLIIFGQAMTRCHRFLAPLMMNATDNNLIEFDSLLFMAFRHNILNRLKLGLHLITFRRLIRNLPSGELKDYAREISFLSIAYSVISDLVILVNRGKLKYKERMCANLADMLSYLYIGVAVLKYYEEHKCDDDKSELYYARWSLDYVLYNFQESFFDLVDNFSNRIIAVGFLKFKIFPLGRRFKKPSHLLESYLAEMMQKPSLLRDRLKQSIFLDPGSIQIVEDAHLAQLEIAYIQEKLDIAIKNKVINRKLNIKDQLNLAQSKSIITKMELESYQKFIDKYYTAIMVDAFDSGLVKVDDSYSESIRSCV